MAEFEQGNGLDLDEAAALQIGMSFVKARRAASELIAEAERMAREFVMTPDVRAPSGTPTRTGPASTDREATEAGVVDLRNLAAQVDDIEGALLSSHERILRLFNEARSGYAGGSQLVQKAAPPAEQETEVAPAPEQPAPVREFVPEPEPAPAERISNVVRPASPATDLAPPVAASPAAPVSVPSNGTASSPAGWGPPDPSSRVDLLAGATAPEQQAPPAEHRIFQPVPEPSRESVLQPTREPVEQPGVPWAPGSGSWSAEEAVPKQPSPQPPEQPAAGPAQPYETAGQPAKSSSTLWLVNVIGFSVLVIVVVVVMMLANVL